MAQEKATKAKYNGSKRNTTTNENRLQLIVAEEGIRTKGRCSKKELLLNFIVAEKITDIAKRAVRFTSIKTYKDLVEALRQNVEIISSVHLFVLGK